MISPEILEGPLAPGVLHDSIGVNGEQLDRYAQRYSSYMAETGATRDSLRHSIQAMRDAFESGDRSAARSRRDAIQRQSDDLAKRDRKFDKELKDGLSKDQKKRYEKWNDAREKAQQERFHHEHRPPPGGNL